MGIFHIHRTSACTIDEVQVEQVQIGIQLRLPFRYRVTELFRFYREEVGIELCLRNRLPIATGTHVSDLIVGAVAEWETIGETICTHALMIFDNPELSTEA